MKVYQRIASLLLAIENCAKSGNDEWSVRHTATLDDIIKNELPSGAGWDAGTTLDGRSTPEKLVFFGSFHHMDQHGGYDGWTDHTITVTASLVHDIKLKISGRDRNEIKDYLHELFHDALTKEVSRAQVQEC